MWKTRFIANGRCYHLISRLAHQAFFLDDDEKTRRGYALMYGNGDWEAIQACHEQSMCEAMGEVLAEREKEERAVKGRSASLLAKVIVERTDPAHPQSPQQKYSLV